MSSSAILVSCTSRAACMVAIETIPCHTTVTWLTRDNYTYTYIHTTKGLLCFYKIWLQEQCHKVLNSALWLTHNSCNQKYRILKAISANKNGACVPINVLPPNGLPPMCYHQWVTTNVLPPMLPPMCYNQCVTTNGLPPMGYHQWVTTNVSPPMCYHQWLLGQWL